MDQVIPAIPPVRPRVAHDGDDRPLDDVIEELLDEGVRGIAVLHGLRGAGKSTALGFLACRFAEEPALALVDNPTEEELAALDPQHLNVVASWKIIRRLDVHLPLRFWGVDQYIEYLLHAHPAACGDVMRRLAAAGRPPWPPALVVALLDQFAADLDAVDPETVVLAHLRTQLAGHNALEAAQGFCLALKCDRTLLLARSYEMLAACSVPPAINAILSHEVAIDGLAGDALFDLLQRDGLNLPPSLSRGMIRAVARRCRETPSVQMTLRRLIDDPLQQHIHAAAGSLLAATDPAWRPLPIDGVPRKFSKAIFAAVDWPDVDLRDAMLHHADFSAARLNNAQFRHADLQQASFAQATLLSADFSDARCKEANFDGADLTGAKLFFARLVNASFVDAQLTGGNLTRANLTCADLTGANLAQATLIGVLLAHAKLIDANLAGANLEAANLTSVDLRRTKLADANLASATLTRANLEDIYFPDAQLTDAKLTRAQLTGSAMPRAQLRGADLSSAGLAEIDWEDADLRDANFEGATFHLGSSRSGLIDSPIALEGNMTGFYNDDFEDRAYKRPEEIRKANLRGADLRGAKLSGVNLYLVDLRDARLDPDALQHARNCAAILEDVPAA